MCSTYFDFNITAFMEKLIVLLEGFSDVCQIVTYYFHHTKLENQEEEI